MTPTGMEPAPADATEARVLPGTRDPLGMMQYLRNVDWSKTPEVQGPVYDGRKLYDVRARLAGKSASVTVAAGSYTASKIEIRVFDKGVEMKDASFNLFLANNAGRTPVLLEATLPFATARVELVKAK
jgi:expansin (peptidoglycan-binding protein)